MPAAREALEQLARLETGVNRIRRAGALALQRQDLAIDGEFVMGVIGSVPGPSVGRALRHLTLRVVEDPSLNTPEKLRKVIVVPGRLVNIVI